MEDNCGGHEAMGVVCSNGDEAEGSGAGSGQVEVAVAVKSATTGGGVEGVPVTLTVDNLVLSEITNIEGVAVFTLSADYVGMWATIVMETEGYATVTIVREIVIESEIINIFASPELAEGEHRIVLSWETERDLDIYALGRDRTTGEIVCKTWYADRSGCAGVNLDVDNMFGYGPETITFSDADNDAYEYELYVNDYDGIGIANTGAHIILYGENNIELDVPTPGNGELWWVLGTFEPSVGTSSFEMIDRLEFSDPDFNEETPIQRKLRKLKKGKKGKKGKKQQKV